MSDLDNILDIDDEEESPVAKPAARKKSGGQPKNMADWLKIYGSAINTEPETFRQLAPTGLMPFDLALGVGGAPLGGIWTIYGIEGTAKTTLCQTVVGAIQRQYPNKIVFIVDAENKWNFDIARANGMNITPGLLEDHQVIIVNPNLKNQFSYEDMVASMEQLMDIAPEGIVAVCDSLDEMSTMSEMAQSARDGGAAFGGMAKANSVTMKRLAGLVKKTDSIFLVVQQARTQIGVTSYGPPPIGTSGGYAIKHGSAVRIQLTTSNAIKNTSTGEILGHEIKFYIKKNNYHNKPHVKFSMELRYGEDGGLDRATGLIDVGIELGLMTRSGANHTFVNITKPDGSAASYNGRERTRQFLIRNPQVAQEFEAQIRRKVWGE